MALVKVKPTSAGRRGVVKVVNANLHKGGIGEDRRLGWSFNLRPTFYFTDAFSAFEEVVRAGA